MDLQERSRARPLTLDPGPRGRGLRTPPREPAREPVRRPATRPEPPRSTPPLRVRAARHPTLPAHRPAGRPHPMAVAPPAARRPLPKRPLPWPRVPLRLGRPEPGRWFAHAALLVFVVAATARLGVSLSGAGLTGNYGYDAAVYYAAGDALTHGWLPYGDFVMLHPPGIMLALTPFAWLGRLTTDHSGYIVGNVAYSLLGALDAVLVLAVARRMRLPRAAALGAALFYAVWYGSVTAEYLIRLEPLGNTFVLLALLAYFGPDTTGRALRCGLALGAAVTVKIWFVVPLAVLLVALAARPNRRSLLAAGGGALTVIVTCYLPFFVAAPSQMWQMVVQDQMGRSPGRPSLTTRLGDMAGVRPAFPSLDGAPVTLVAVGTALLLVLCLALALRDPRARLLVVLAAAQAVVLLAAPPWYRSYADYLAPALALCAGVAGRHLARSRRRLAPLWTLPLAASAAMTVLALTISPLVLVTPFPGKALARATGDLGCIMSDSPMGLVELNALDRSFAKGCRNDVDVVGRIFGPDAPDNPNVPRARNRAWQADLHAYLTSGDAVIVVQAPITGISGYTLAGVQSGRLVATAGGYRVFATGR